MILQSTFALITHSIHRLLMNITTLTALTLTFALSARPLHAQENTAHTPPPASQPDPRQPQKFSFHFAPTTSLGDAIASIQKKAYTGESFQVNLMIPDADLASMQLPETKLQNVTALDAISILSKIHNFDFEKIHGEIVDANGERTLVGVILNKFPDAPAAMSVAEPLPLASRPAAPASEPTSAAALKVLGYGDKHPRVVAAITEEAKSKTTTAFVAIGKLLQRRADGRGYQQRTDSENAKIEAACLDEIIVSLMHIAEADGNKPCTVQAIRDQKILMFRGNVETVQILTNAVAAMKENL